MHLVIAVRAAAHAQRPPRPASHPHDRTLARAAGALALLAVLALPRPATASAMPSGLVVTEFMAGPATDWNGSGGFSSRDDEWVEVMNAGDLTIDLSSFFLTDGDSIPRFGFTGTLAAGERIVVFGSDAYAWERDHGHPAFGLSLANGGDAVILWEITATDTVVADAYAYRSHEAAADRSVGRMPDTGVWALFDGLNPYTGTIEPFGTGCPPSPALVNTCGATPARPVTWGRLKALYR